MEISQSQTEFQGLPFKSAFRPESVAVIGASPTFLKWGHMILTNILAGGYEGRVFPVNQKEDLICGLSVYKEIGDIPGAVDLAFITIPAGKVAAALEQCGRKGVKGIVLITSGFSEADDEGRRLEERIVKICRQWNMLLIGPNTMGVILPHSKLFATATHARPRKGSVAFISQSGNLGNQLILWAQQQGIGISAFVGSGNEAMINCIDYLEYLEKDPYTRTILLYIESVGDGRKFLEAARRINRKKPIIVLKGGRTEAGNNAAASHTGSLGGEANITEAAFRQAGILTSKVPSELLDFSIGFSCLPLPRGNRVGIVTLGGGWGVVTADGCNEKGLVVPRLPEHIIATIGKYLPSFWSRGNPVDLVGTRDIEVPVVAVEELLKWEGIDAVICLGIVGRHELVRLMIDSARRSDERADSKFLNQVESISSGFENDYIERVTELMEKYEKPVIGVSLARSDKGTISRVEGKRYKGVFYQTPEDAVNVLAGMVGYNSFLRKRSFYPL